MSCRLSLVLVLILATAACRAETVPPEIAGLNVYKIWHFDSSADGWTADHNVSPLKVENGFLSFENTGSDPWILNREIGGPDASSYRFIGIKMRSSKGRANQVYFSTDANPGPAGQNVIILPLQTDGKLHFYEIDMSQAKTWSGKVNLLRLDAANGGNEVGAKIDIDWIALYQVPARISMGVPFTEEVTHERARDEDIVVRIPVRNTGGEASGTGVTVMAGGKTQDVKPMQPGEEQVIEFALPGLRKDIPFFIVSPQGMIADGSLCSPATAGGDPGWALGSSKTQLALLNSRAWLTAADDPKSLGSPCGEFRPLATVAYRSQDGAMHYVEVSADSGSKPDPETVTLKAKRKLGDANVRFDWIFKLPKAGDEGTCEWSMRTDAPLDIVRLEGPRLSAFSPAKGAIFPGLEFIEENEPSSAVKHIGPKYADRRIPHPYKIAAPVVAVETNGAVVGLSWDPLAEWTGGQRLPCAQFESPQALSGGKKHLMAVFVPSAPDFVEENHEFARVPFRLEAENKIAMMLSFFARRGERITDVLSAYYLDHGFPKPPPIAHGVDGTIDLCFRAYTETLFSPEKNGWKQHVGLGQDYAFRGDYAALVLGESLRTNNPRLAEKCRLDPKGQLTQYTGTPLGWFTDGFRAAADTVIAQQSADGGFPYAADDEMRKKVTEFAKIAGIESDTLGDVGSTNSGLIAPRLITLLTCALRTGETKYLDAGIRGLAKMNSFAVPRGSQTWEVHMHAPDIYAAGLAVDANVLGYHLTGDDHYLDEARRWALSGLPFIYTWTPPIDPVPAAVFCKDEKGEGKNYLNYQPSEFYENTRRFINPGATIPVMGTTFYVISWFGVPVEWCGLAWANSTRRCTQIRPDRVLNQAADLVFASGTQQQTEKGFLAGTYPDSWNLLTNTANAAFIAPDTIVDYAYSLKGEQRAGAVSTIGFSQGAGRAFFNTFARIEASKADKSALEATLKYYAGQDLYSCVSATTEPRRVLVDGLELKPTTDIEKAASGCLYDPANKALHIKYRSDKRIAKLRIEY